MAEENELTLTEWELRRKRILKEAFRETLIEFGLDPAEPIEIQKDMAFLRRNRTLAENALVKALSALIGVVIPAAIALVVTGLQKVFH